MLGAFRKKIDSDPKFMHHCLSKNALSKVYEVPIFLRFLTFKR